MSETQETEAIEAEIAVHWREEPRIDPPEAFVRQASVRDRSLFETLSGAHFPEGFRTYAELLKWDHPFDTVLDQTNPPFYRWFPGGRLNATVNTLDRHLGQARDRIAYYFVPEDESETITSLTYGELAARVNQLAGILRDRFGCVAGDRITIHLPMVPELPIAMLACARLGIIHSVVFSGFSGKAAGNRIVDSESRLLMTMDGYSRNGQWLDHKIKADEAYAAAAAQGVRLEGVLVFERHPGHYRSASPVGAGRDIAMTPLLAAASDAHVAPISLESNDGLFIMYSSGTTGRPKGCLHGIGGYLAWVTATSRTVLDLKPGDVYWCMADIGWITGHSYIVYGPLSIGATSVIYEGVPNFPDAGRPWRIAEKLGVQILHTSPTAIRALRREGPDAPARYHPPFRLLATVGEPIEPEAWHWYHERVGHGKAVVVDTYWQTETGGHLLSTLPGIEPMKPGSAGPALPGIEAAIYDEAGRRLPPGSKRAGMLAIERPWPGLMLGIWKDPARFQETYFEPLKRGAQKDRWLYCTHDAATQSADGYFRILGRTDDVINVAGHRLGSKEIESAALGVSTIAEAAVIPYPDPVKGHVPLLFVATKPGTASPKGVARSVEQAVTEAIGPIARPRAVLVVEDLPKTRSGKIMRRVLRAIAQGQDPGDLTTLANPESVDAIRKILQQVLHAPLPDRGAH
ncbi:MAG: acetate--CoA ligase [Gammaproteobacteria bacterium]